ncbi:MAG: phage major capsid protein [Variovorax paradoxus]|nr:MAG: phage major capsid protein [Variovorax paradoxus]PZQ08946.1 MAG: phage major capsid protein [Variovorax paradoxus]
MSLHRSYAIQSFTRAKDGGGDLVVEMSLASAQPVERWWGTEVLDVRGADLGRLNDGAALLFNHNWDDLRGVHVPGSVRVDRDDVIRGKVRITSATQLGRDTIALVEGNVLSKVSVGYEVRSVVERSKGSDGATVERTLDGATFQRLLDAHVSTRDARAFRRALDASVGSFDRPGAVSYVVTDFELLESSLVTVPADATVGVGRSVERASLLQPAAPAAHHPRTVMDDQNQSAAGTVADDTNRPGSGPQNRGAAMPPAPAGTQGNQALEIEQARRRGIDNLCRANKIDDNIRAHWVGSGLSIDQISEDLLQIVEQRGRDNPQSEAKLGLSASETKRYSLMNAVRACADKNWAQAGFELECSREISKRLQVVVDPNKFYVPFEVQGRQVNASAGSMITAEQQRQMGRYARRDLTAGAAAAGGYLVGTENMSFIEILRNRSIAYRMGARRLAGLQGNVTIPRQTAAATAVWLANESSSITESQQTLGQLAFSPKTVGAYTEISRQLMLQSSPDAEAMVTADLGSVCALAVDVGAIRGSGTAGEPTGIVNTAGIGSVTGTALGYGGVLEFQSDVATANVQPSAGGYVTTPLVAAQMMQRVKWAGTASPLWEGNLWDGQMAGFGAMSTNQMAAATMLFGDWAQLVVAEWGVLQIEVNPYANFQAGIIGVRAMVSVDVGLRYAAAFSLANTIT